MNRDTQFCDICSLEYSKSNRSNHVQTYKHKLAAQEQRMEKNIEINYKEDTNNKYILKEKFRPNIIALMNGEFIKVIEKNDEYFFQIDGVDKPYKEIHTEKYQIEPLPLNNLERTVVYIIGRSGSGKSYFCRDFIIKWKEMNPYNDVYIVSREDNDEAFKNLNAYKINNNNFAEGTVTMDEIDEGSLVVMDDIDSIINDNNIIPNIIKLRDEIMESGRKRKISLLVTSHRPIKGKETQLLLNEANYIVLFPQGMTSLDKFLYVKLDMMKEQVRKVCGLKTRYVIIHNGAPQWILGKHDLYFLKG
jgi:hypothetical protein